MHGYALLIAATPPGKHPALQATAALPALSAVRPAALVGQPTANVVQVADPADPQTVLTHLRTAAAHDGPLVVYVAGQLVLDPRQRLPHLVLTGPGGRTVRYTGLPWHWIAAELTLRPSGSATVYADLVTDADAWERLSAEPGLLGSGLTLYGALSGPPARRQTAEVRYSQALADVLRAATARLADEELHREAAARAGLDGVHGPEGRPVLLLGGSALPHFPAGGQHGGPVRVPYGQAPYAQAAPLPDLRAQTVPLPDPRAQTVPLPDPRAQTVPLPDPRAQTVPLPDRNGQAAAARHASVPEAAAVAEPAPAPVPAPPRAPGPASAGPGTEPGGVREGAPGVPAYAYEAPPAPPGAQPRPPATGAPADDPHEVIFTAAREGRHGEASAIAAAWEQAALRAGGPMSAEAVHWMEVRADLARLAGDPARSCALWLHAASVRQRSGQDPADPEVYGAVDRAHHCWHLVTDPVAARELGPELAELREWAPGRRRGAVRDVRARLDALEGRGPAPYAPQTQPPVPPGPPPQGY